MDRPIDPIVERSRRRRRLAAGGLAIVVPIVAAVTLPGLLSPSIARDAVRVARVDEGPVDATISATGLVVPAIEQVVTTPVEARVLRILHRAGASLRTGQAIIELDVSEARLAVDRLSQDLAIKANEQALTRLGLEKRLIDIDGRTEVKRLQLEQYRVQLDRDRSLFKEGLLSDELLRKSELAASQAAIELKQLEAERQNAQQATRAEIAGLALEVEKLRHEEREARRTLDLAALRADRNGILVWTLTQEGVAIRKGDPVARIADPASFRVDASVSDVHARRLAVGQPAVVEAGGEALAASVVAVNPTVVNGVITVALGLEAPAHPLLRSNLRVDVEIVTARKARALRIRRGPFATGEGAADVFVLRGVRAVKTPVRFGLSSQDYFEIASGLRAGDEAIISDMRDYQSLDEVRLR